MSGKSRILVVDDNESFCHNLVDILEMKGYEAVAAYDGSKALELVEQDGFDLVLMDVKMPVMNGVESFKKIKEIAPATAVIMITAHAVEDLVREALKEGAFGFLKKPLDFDELFELIERATGNGAMILVVDDDKDLCAGLQDVLQDKGCRVSVAHDGDAAVEKAVKNDFDIMLIDLKLPPLNGLEIYLTIRDFRPHVVAVIITGYGKELDSLAQQALQKNAYTCLEKPIDMDELLALVARIKEQKDKGTLEKPQ